MPASSRADLAGRSVRAVPVLLAVLLGILAPQAAHANTAAGPAAVAEAFKKGPVYVDARAESQLSKTAARELSEKIRKADKPVFVAVLPQSADYPPQTLLSDLRTLTGITGVYAVRLGDGFNAGADRQVMPNSAVDHLKGAVKRSYASDPQAQLNTFVDQALGQAGGAAPDSWQDATGDAGSGPGTGSLVVGGLVIAGTVGGVWALSRRARKKREERERAELAALRVVVDEDITAFGEELDRLDFAPSEPGATDGMRDDYTRALDAYDQAKALLSAATGPQDVAPVTETLAGGRFALATLASRRSGAPLPERRVPCFFDPRHGPSVADVPWAPAGGTTRPVPACATDAAQVQAGGTPESRMVHTAQGPQPYWNAGPAYAPWAGGYFGGVGGVLGGLAVGSVLGSLLSAPAAFAGAGEAASVAGLPEGGEFSGADFNSSDFGGGFGGGFGSDAGGDSGGGDFGGGDW
ncbi:hypothetical protein [Streptomyces sp. NPDC088725]|uniref:hypothetical protein n=1 Tax=Streptomyces sp. NPDC088725 TaxID=3365873 RepID=UPI00380EB599